MHVCLARNPMTTNEGVFEPGTKVGRYELVRFIGGGGMGAVYEALHTDLKKRVAFKALHSNYADSPEARLRFLQEGELASRIRHPNVVEIFDVGVENRTPYLVMELLEGEDLATLIERKGPLSVRQTAHVLLPVIAAVATAHEEGVLHRDLKPENIFLARTRHSLVQPKLLDFGISKLTTGESSLSLTAGASVLGTPQYMSPEQVTNAESIDMRTDQYSLGVIMYECVTGKKAFDGETLYTLMHNIVAGNFTPPSAVNERLSREFETIVLRAMAAEADERYADMPTLGRALLDFASQRDVAVWKPAFAPDRLSGTPLNPSLAPSGPAPVVTPQENKVNDAQALGGTLRVTGTEFIPQRTGSVRRFPWGLALGGLTVLSLAGTMLAYGPLNQGGAHAGQAGAKEFRVRVQALPTEARFELDGQELGTGGLDLELPLDGARHTLRVTAAGFESQELSFRDQPPPSQVTLVRQLPRGVAFANKSKRRSRMGAVTASGTQAPSAHTSQPSAPKDKTEGSERAHSPQADAAVSGSGAAEPRHAASRDERGTAKPERQRTEHRARASARKPQAESLAAALETTELDPAPLKPGPVETAPVETSANNSPILD